MAAFNRDVYEKRERKFRQLLRSYFTRHMFQDGTPLVFSFLVTNRCFLKCKHCFYHETLEEAKMRLSPDELTFDEYREMSNSMEWIFMSLFCGGEPFIREDLHEIVGVFRKNNQLFWADSATNGQMQDEIVRQVELICQQDKFKVYSLSFSIDGFEEHSDEVRGKGTFKRSVETWKECKKIAAKYGNLEMNFCTTINSVNQDSLPDFFKWGLKEMHPDRIALLKIRQSPRGGEHLKDVDVAHYDAARAVISDATRDGKLGDVNHPGSYLFFSATNYISKTLRTGKRSFYCYAGKHGAWVDYNGDINVCEIFPDAKVAGEAFKLGNIRDYDMDFLKLWNSENALNIKKMVNKHGKCAACTHETEGFVPSLYFEPNVIKPITK